MLAEILETYNRYSNTNNRHIPMSSFPQKSLDTIFELVASRAIIL